MADVLKEVVDDPENQEYLNVALTKLLREDPVTFYRVFVLPRMEKMRATPDKIDFSELTPAEEAALMDSLTVDYENHRKKQLEAEAASRELAPAAIS